MLGFFILFLSLFQDSVGYAMWYQSENGKCFQICLIVLCFEFVFEFYFQSIYISSWEASPWTACSVSCDEGIQIRNISCLKEVSGSLFLESTLEECSHLTAPNTSQSCNLRDCFSWTASAWSQVIMAIVIVSPT